MSNINMSNITYKNSILNKDNSNKNAQTVQLNEILSGAVKNINDEYITLKGKNYSIDVPTKDIVLNGADPVSFKVMNADNNTITLKQLGLPEIKTDITEEKLKMKSSEEILEMFKQNNMLVEEDILEVDPKKLDEQKMKQIIRRIQNDILFAASNSSESAITELVANNIDITKITLNVLTKVTNEIDKKPFNKVTDEEINEITQKYLDKNNISAEGFTQKAEIIKALKESGLTVTDNNIQQIENSILKFEYALDKQNFEPLVNLDNVTIEEFIELSYSKFNTPADEVSKNENLYEALANKLGFEFNDELKNTFNIFLSEDIAITKENIEKLNETAKTLNDLSLNTLIDKIIKTMANGEKAINTSLLDTIETVEPDISLIDKTLTTKISLENVKQENIAFLINNNRNLTINNIKTTVANNDVSLVNEQNNDLVTKTYKDLLVLMQKLTFESAHRLAKSGIDIDTKTVTDALNTVNNLEQNSYKIALISAEINADEENIKTVSTFMDKLASLKVLNKNYLNIDGDKIIENKSEFSNLFKNSSLAYDVFSTKVSSKWNDKVTDYKTQIEQILEELNMETTDENIEACEILIKSKVDISIETLNSVKDLNLKIDNILDTLHPRIVAKMISDGINPLELDLDEITNYINSYNEKYDTNLANKIAENIVKLQKDKSIDDDTKNAVKSFYKALNIILSNEKASIGSFVNTDHSYTVKNMLDTAKYFSETKGIKSSLNEQIGDNVLETISNENSITSIINKAVNKSSYEQSLLEKLANNSNNDSLKDLVTNNENYENLLIENVIKSLEAFNKNTQTVLTENDVANLVDQLSKALENSPLSIELLLGNETPLTIKNINTLTEMINTPTKLKSRLKDLIDDDNDLKDSFKEISEEDLSKLSGIGSILDVQIGEISKTLPSTEDLIYNKTQVLSSLNLMSLFNKNEQSPYTQMVVKLPLSDEVTTVNMYVVDDEFELKETKTICFSLETEYLGNIEATIKISLNSVDIIIKGNENGIDYLEENEDEIKELFLSSGYKEVSLDFINSSVDSIFTNKL